MDYCEIVLPPLKGCYGCIHYAERHQANNRHKHYYSRHGVCLVLAKPTNPDGVEYAWACKGNLIENRN